jgi:chorismate--pyruvate lyase
LHMTEMKPIWQALWLPAASAPLAALPQTLQSWLLETGSLTARLKQQGQFALQVLEEQHEVLPAFLQQRWQASAGTRREVLLSLDGRPAIYAQSFWSAAAGNSLLPLAQLGAMPLGEFIFAQPDLQRSGLEVAVLDAGFMLPARDTVLPCWGRRSYFALLGHELLVQEVFFAGVFD